MYKCSWFYSKLYIHVAAICALLMSSKSGDFLIISPFINAEG